MPGGATRQRAYRHVLLDLDSPGKLGSAGEMASRVRVHCPLLLSPEPRASVCSVLTCLYSRAPQHAATRDARSAVPLQPACLMAQNACARAEHVERDLSGWTVRPARRFLIASSSNERRTFFPPVLAMRSPHGRAHQWSVVSAFGCGLGRSRGDPASRLVHPSRPSTATSVALLLSAPPVAHLSLSVTSRREWGV